MIALLFCGLLLAGINLFGPSLLAKSRVNPLTYLKFTRKLSLSVLAYLFVLVATFPLARSEFQERPYQTTMIFVILFALPPLLFLTLLRVYRSDLQMFQATYVHVPFINDALHLNENRKSLQQFLFRMNTTIFAITLISSITTVYLLIVQQQSIGSAPLAVPAIAGLIALVLKTRKIFLPRAIQPDQETLARVETIVNSVASEMQMKVPKIFLHPGFATAPYNCAAAPKGLYISAPLIFDFSDEEIRFVVAHELAHLKLRHVHKRRQAQYIFAGLLFASAAFLFLARISPAFVAISTLLALAVIIGAIIHPRVFPTQEYEADAEAIRLTRDPEALRSCLYRISANSLFPLLSEFDMPTHPSTPNRYKRAMELTETLSNSSN